jgi:hypothetical protein
MILRSFSMITGAGYCAKFKSDSDGIISRSAKKISETLCIGFTSFSGNGRSTCVEGGWHHVGILSLKFTDRLLGTRCRCRHHLSTTRASTVSTLPRLDALHVFGSYGRLVFDSCGRFFADSSKGVNYFGVALGSLAQAGL